MTECPLQLVEFELVQAGCCERIPQQDLSRHMEEGALRHLLSMSLLNLNLTRELHQKMAQKDQQIAELQGQLQEQNRKLEERFQQIAVTHTQLQDKTRCCRYQSCKGIKWKLCSNSAKTFHRLYSQLEDLDHHLSVQ